MILIDTDVIIEFARGSSDAARWVASLGEITLPIPGMVAIELIAGSTNRVQHDRARRFVDRLTVVWHDETDNKRAYQLMERHRLSSGLSLTDYWIAAQALNRDATLYTFNLKHFSAIQDLQVALPYSR